MGPFEICYSLHYDITLRAGSYNTSAGAETVTTARTAEGGEFSVRSIAAASSNVKCTNRAAVVGLMGLELGGSKSGSRATPDVNEVAGRDCAWAYENVSIIFVSTSLLVGRHQGPADRG